MLDSRDESLTGFAQQSPDYLIESELARGQLVDTKGEALETEAAYHLVSPEEGMRSPLIEDLITHVRASIGNRRIIVPR